MDARSRSQLALATVGTVVTLGAAAVPATIQLLDDEPAAAPAPASAVPVPTVTPQPPAPAADPSATARRDRGGRNARADKPR